MYSAVPLPQLCRRALRHLRQTERRLWWRPPPSQVKEALWETRFLGLLSPTSREVKCITAGLRIAVVANHLEYNQYYYGHVPNQYQSDQNRYSIYILCFLGIVIWLQAKGTDAIWYIGQR